MIFNDAMPIYEQIKNDIVDKIENGIYVPGVRLPSERQLAEEYAVSRVTVRQAVGELVNKGILHKKVGTGTYVRATKVEQSLVQLKGIIEELRQHGYNVSIRVIETVYVKWSSKNRMLWENLKLDRGEKVYKIKRVIMANNQPLLIDYNYFPEEIGRKYEMLDVSKDVIFRALEALGYHVEYATQKVSAKNATREQARLLQIEERDAVLEVERLTFSGSDVPLIYTRAVYVGTKYSYSAVLRV